MPQHANEELRSAAEVLLSNTRSSSMSYRGGGGGGGGYVPPGFEIPRTHSINLITEEFLAGYMQDGRMSVVRRFFCLFVTFDLFFVSLLWLICIMLNGDNIFQAFQKQIMHYTIYTSLFDVVIIAICRFTVLIFFYALLYINHWFIIALSTSSSCLFLISKVFVFDWVGSSQQVFQVVLILTSFVLAWGEAWFLDCRVIPQERHARRYFTSITSSSDRSPLIAAPPFLATTIQGERPPPGSVANFYSALGSGENSDEEEEQDEEYRQMGLDCVRKAYELLESADWKVEKVTPKGDTIQSTQREKLGKIYKLTGRLKYSAKALLTELFYRIEDVPTWNPSILESKIVRKVNSYTDITYQASAGGGGGMVKSRDFINLRCWRLFRNGKLCEHEFEYNRISSDEENILDRSCEGSVSTVSDLELSVTPQSSSVGSSRAKFPHSSSGAVGESKNIFQTLSKSLGAKDFSAVPHIDFDEPPPLDEELADVSDEPQKLQTSTTTATSARRAKNKVWISAAISVDYPQLPPTTKYTRGENIIAGFAFREIEGKPDACIFEWILCLDMKGYIPRYILDTAYTTFMSDYMTHLRKYVSELRQRRRKVPKK